MNINAQEKPILTFAADEAVSKRISDYHFEKRVETKSEAIRMLVQEGLKKWEGLRRIILN